MDIVRSPNLKKTPFLVFLEKQHLQKLACFAPNLKNDNTFFLKNNVSYSKYKKELKNSIWI